MTAPPRLLLLTFHSANFSDFHLPSPKMSRFFPSTKDAVHAAEDTTTEDPVSRKMDLIHGNMVRDSTEMVAHSEGEKDHEIRQTRVPFSTTYQIPVMKTAPTPRRMQQQQPFGFQAPSAHMPATNANPPTYSAPMVQSAQGRNFTTPPMNVEHAGWNVGRSTQSGSFNLNQGKSNEHSTSLDTIPTAPKSALVATHSSRTFSSYNSPTPTKQPQGNLAGLGISGLALPTADNTLVPGLGDNRLFKSFPATNCHTAPLRNGSFTSRSFGPIGGHLLPKSQTALQASNYTCKPLPAGTMGTSNSFANTATPDTAQMGSFWSGDLSDDQSVSSSSPSSECSKTAQQGVLIPLCDSPSNDPPLGDPPVWNTERDEQTFSLISQDYRESYKGAFEQLKTMNPDTYQMPWGYCVICIKCENLDNILISLEHGVWALSKPITKRITDLCNKKEGEPLKMLFLFSVSGRYVHLEHANTAD